MFGSQDPFWDSPRVYLSRRRRAPDALPVVCLQPQLGAESLSGAEGGRVGGQAEAVGVAAASQLVVS
jgi:hypothetical protein